MGDFLLIDKRLEVLIETQLSKEENWNEEKIEWEKNKSKEDNKWDKKYIMGWENMK